jgi:hypothetical protein
MIRRMVSVDALALQRILQALVGQPHEIREIMMTRSVAALTGDDPIQTLLDDYNEGIKVMPGEGNAEAVRYLMAALGFGQGDAEFHAEQLRDLYGPRPGVLPPSCGDNGNCAG